MEILFRQAKDWLTERGRKTAGSVEHGLEYARSAAEHAAGKGAEYSRRLIRFTGNCSVDSLAFSDFSRRFMDEIKNPEERNDPENRRDGRFLKN